MKTIALTDETAPARTQSNILAVVSRSRPQSSAFTIRDPRITVYSSKVLKF
jgi:hypothetical protein